MSKGLGKLQLAIMEILKELPEEGYSYSAYWLEDITGASKNSVNRAVNGLISRGLVVRRKCKDVGNFNTWCYEYTLTENEQLHDEYQAKRLRERQESEIKARELGYESSFLMNLEKMHARFD